MQPAARLLALLLLATLPREAPAGEPPARVVSINLCTDQLALLLARPGQLAAVSRVAHDPVASALWQQAADLPTVPPDAEAIGRLDADLVLAGTWDPPATLALLRRLGYRVETFGLESSFDDIRAHVTRMGDLLGTPDRATALLAEMDAELARPLPPGPPPRAALFSANGYTSGSGTLAHEILTAAGFSNIAAERGLAGLVRLPLEVLVMSDPDLLVTGQNYGSPALAQSILRHPAARSLAAGRAAVTDNLWVCGTPLAAEAVAALRAQRP
jgi:iron complex transport system substrate-binding protein